MRTQIEVDNETAKELAGSGDAVLKALERDLEASVFLRGNVVTLDGEPAAVQAAAPRLVLDRGGDVGQAELAHEGAIERRDRHARPEAAEVDGRHGEAGGERVARLAQLGAGQRAVTVEVAVVEHVEQARLRGHVLVGAIPRGERRGARRRGDGGQRQGEGEEAAHENVPRPMRRRP